MSQRRPSRLAASSVALAALLASGLACDDKPVATTAPSQSTTSLVSAPATVTVAAAVPSQLTPAPSASATKLAERMKCNALLPESVLTGALSNMKLGQPPSPCPDCGPVCSLVNPAKPYEGVSITYICNEPKYSKEVVATKLAVLKKVLAKSKPVALGYGGIGGEKEGGMFYQVAAYSGDCMVTVDWMRGTRDNTVQVAKAAIAGIKASDLVK
jgi:hypothetical protein